MDKAQAQRLTALDHAHLWHPFTPMRQWRQAEPLIIESGEGDYLVDIYGKRYLDGVSSLWCNVHGHRVPQIDAAIRDQLDKIAHSTLLGLSNVPAIELASRLCAIAPGRLNKVFFGDAGATALEVAFKMAVGYWYHAGQGHRNILLGLSGAYHGDTAGSMSVGFSDLFHRPFQPLTFHTETVPSPDVAHQRLWIERFSTARSSPQRLWSLEDTDITAHVRDQALAALDQRLDDLGEKVAAIVVEPIVQGAAGIIVQPTGYLVGLTMLAKKYGVLLIADEVAVGFGRTGRMFACQHEGVEPDILCLGKGITGGYLSLSAAITSDEIEEAFTGELDEHRTLYHGHTYAGNQLACAAALASLDLFESNDLISEVHRKAALLTNWLEPLRDGQKFPMVYDVRQRGLIVGIELVDDHAMAFEDPTKRLSARVCAACREKGVLIRPLGNVVVLMPPLAISDAHLKELVDVVVGQLVSP